MPRTVALQPTGAGQPLPPVVQRQAERLFNAEFSAVRVHVGPQASAIGASVFTTGNDIYFAPGQYDPGTSRGLQLIGHELAHVVQQRAGRASSPFAGYAVVQDVALEAEAERMGLRMMAPAPPVPPPVQRMAAQPQVVQPMWPFDAFPVTSGLTLARRLYQWATSAAPSPGYYVKILTKPNTLPPRQAREADTALDVLEQRFMAKRDGNGQAKPSHRAMSRGTRLGDLDPNGKLHIIGHGYQVQDPQTLEATHANLLSGYTTAEVANMLVQQYRLPNTFQGSIVLLVCFSGVSSVGHQSLAEHLLADIRAKGPNPASIKALLGTGTVDETTGSTVVFPNQAWAAKKRLEPLWRALADVGTNFSNYTPPQLYQLYLHAINDPAVLPQLHLLPPRHQQAMQLGSDTEKKRVISALKRIVHGQIPHLSAYTGGMAHKVVYT